MNHFSVALASLVLASCAQATPNASSNSSTEQPEIVASTPSSRIVQYESTVHGHLEAWEIVTDWVDGIYLNYSRFPYGDLTYAGQSTWICHVKVQGEQIAPNSYIASRKLAGVSENPERLKKALNVVIKDRFGHPVDDIKCEVFAELLKRHPSYEDLRIFFLSL
jgi:hypothetical protein